MPELPIYQQQYQQSSRRSSAEDFGAIEGAAQQGFGQSLTQMGDVLTKIKQADDLEKARQVASETSIQLYKDVDELRKSSPESGEGHTESTEQMIREKWDMVSEGFSGKALEYLNSSRRKSSESIIPSEIMFEGKMRGVHRARLEKGNHDRESNTIFTNPKIVDNVIGNMMERVNGYSFSPSNPKGISAEAVDELIQANMNDYRNSAVRGKINNSESVDELEQIKTEIEDHWQGLLIDSDYQSAIKAADVKLNQLKRNDEINLKVTKNEMVKGLNDYQSYVLDGNFPERPDGLSDGEITTIFGKDAPELLQDIHRAEKRSVELGIIANGSAVDAESTLQNAVNSLNVNDYKDNKATVKLLKAAYDKRTSALKDQGADYVMTHDKSLRNDATDLKELDKTNPDVAKQVKPRFRKKLVQSQIDMGVDPYNVKVLTSNEIDYYKKLFNDVYTQQGEDISAAIDELKSDTGDLFNVALDNLKDAKAVPKGLSVMVGINDPLERSKMAEGLRDFKELSKDIPKADYNTADSLQPLFETMPISVYQNVGQNMSEIIDATNALAVVNLRNNVNDPIGSAVEQVAGKFNIYGKIRIPKEISADMGDIAFNSAYSNMLLNFDKDFGDNVGWDRIGTSYGLSSEQIREDVVKSITDGKMNIYTRPDNTGLVITSNTGAFLPDVNGNPLTIPFEKFKEYRYSLDSNFEKLYGNQ